MPCIKLNTKITMPDMAPLHAYTIAEPAWKSA